jgi:hypothetical protein
VTLAVTKVSNGCATVLIGSLFTVHWAYCRKFGMGPYRRCPPPFIDYLYRGSRREEMTEIISTGTPPRNAVTEVSALFIKTDGSLGSA